MGIQSGELKATSGHDGMVSGNKCLCASLTQGRAARTVSFPADILHSGDPSSQWDPVGPIGVSTRNGEGKKRGMEEGEK